MTTIWRRKRAPNEKPEMALPQEANNAMYAAVMGRMADPKTRVQFRLETRPFLNRPIMPASAAIGQITRIFNMRAADTRLMESSGGAIIICSPLQFAGFLVWRHGAGFANGFADLCVRLVPAGDAPDDLPTITARKES